MSGRAAAARALAVAAALVWVCGTAWGQEAGPSPPPGGMPGAEGSVIEKLRANGARVTALGERGGLAGWFVEPSGGGPYSLYVTPDGHSVAGLLYGPGGALLTRGQVRNAARETERPARVARAPAGDVPVGVKRAPAGAFEGSVAAFGFTLGQSGPLAVVLADPGCAFSRSTVEALGRKAVGGAFRLHVVPVGVLGAESAAMAVRIAASADPALAWFGRGVAPIHRAGGQWVEGNNAAFESWGEDAVPLIAWTAPSGAKFYAVGEIRDAERWAAGAFGAFGP